MAKKRYFEKLLNERKQTALFDKINGPESRSMRAAIYFQSWDN